MWVNNINGGEFYHYILEKHNYDLEEYSLYSSEYNGEPICRIHTVENKSGKYYRCEVFKKRLFPTISVTIREEDLEVAKLKSLIRAKDLGWDIKSIN